MTDQSAPPTVVIATDLAPELGDIVDQYVDDGLSDPVKATAIIQAAANLIGFFAAANGHDGPEAIIAGITEPIANRAFAEARKARAH